MAQKTVVELTDDIDGTPATGTVTFGFEGKSYEIDLNDTHAKEMRDAFAPYTDHARTVGRSAGRAASHPQRHPRRRRSSRTIGDHGYSTSEVRDWAKSQGIQVSNRGRIPAHVASRYTAAH